MTKERREELRAELGVRYPVRRTRFQPGDKVYVRVYGGEEVERVVVEELEPCVVICTEETWAKRQQWDFLEGLGFPHEDVRHRGIA